MWTSSRVNEIEDYVSVNYEFGSSRIIGIICGSVGNKSFLDENLHKFITYDAASAGRMDFFWLGVDQQLRRLSKEDIIRTAVPDETLRVKETEILESKLGLDSFALLDGFQMVLMPVYSGKIIYRAAVIADISRMINKGASLEVIFRSFIIYSRDVSTHCNSGLEKTLKEIFTEQEILNRVMKAYSFTKQLPLEVVKSMFVGYFYATAKSNGLDLEAFR